jgi:hypothetical protein
LPGDACDIAEVFRFDEAETERDAGFKASEWGTNDLMMHRGMEGKRGLEGEESGRSDCE